jgi:hypothetical protein
MVLIGYEHNNLAEFADAVRSFEQALDYAAGSRRFELERILLESRFLNKAKEKPALLIQPLENLLERIELADISQDEKEARKTRILGTLGTYCLPSGVNFSNKDNPKKQEGFSPERRIILVLLQRRNVTKEDFLKELRQLERERIAGQQLVQRG